jgi:hypothetical protein
MMKTIKMMLQVIVVGVAVEVGVMFFLEGNFLAAYWTGAALFICLELRLGFLYPGGERGALAIESVSAGIYLALTVFAFLFGSLAWWGWLALLGRVLIRTRQRLRRSRAGENFRYHRRPLLAAVMMAIGFALMAWTLFPH